MAIFNPNICAFYMSAVITKSAVIIGVSTVYITNTVLTQKNIKKVVFRIDILFNNSRSLLITKIYKRKAMKKNEER